MTEKKIITKFDSREHFLEILKLNQGLIIIKFGAEWCRPCKTIAPILDYFFATSPNNVLCCDIDIDESFDVYAYLNKKKMVNGIPVILCYKKGNISFIPDESITGADKTELDSFFRKCGNILNQLTIEESKNQKK